MLVILGGKLFCKVDLTQQKTYTHDELVAGMRKRDQVVFAYLYDHYSRALFGIIHTIVNNEPESEDLLQKTFLKIWENFQSYDEKKGRLYTWMLNIARNLAIDSTRTRHMKMRDKIQSQEEHVYTLENKAVTNEDTTGHIGLKNILAGLKEEQRLVIDLAYFEGYTQEEISQKLNVPLGTVKTRVRQALLKLRELTKNELLR